MAKAIEQITLDNGIKLMVGHFSLGLFGAKPGSPKQAVHDGDTVSVHAPGNMSVRLLGVDAPEISYKLPGDPRDFVPISDAGWTTFLSDPFADAEVGPKLKALPKSLRDHLAVRLGADTAANHLLHANKATLALEAAVQQDLTNSGQPQDTFRFFLAFSYEILDRFGRLLAFINMDKTTPPRPLDYNRRLLKEGLVTPYFIWPNVDPFRTKGDIHDAVIEPGTAKTEAEGPGKLRDVRTSVQKARQAGMGIFDKANPLKLLPFELRFLADGRAPARWVIDLSKNDDVLIPPTDYHTIPNPEDQLFIPSDRVPLFIEKGWKKL